MSNFKYVIVTPLPEVIGYFQTEIHARARLAELQIYEPAFQAVVCRIQSVREVMKEYKYSDSPEPRWLHRKDRKHG